MATRAAIKDSAPKAQNRTKGAVRKVTTKTRSTKKASNQNDLMVDYAGQVDAINKSQAVIEFNLDGTIIKANENFLAAVGYTSDEIVGQHHRMFVEDSYGESQEYRDFWGRLNRGEYQSGAFKRFGKGGNEIWIQASYNPIADNEGNIVKVVKYASDITEQVRQKNFGDKMRNIVENVPLNVVYCDTDFTINYMNQASLETLQTIEQYLPVKAADVVGQSMDIFHKDPAHQRKIMSNPKNLPHRAIIEVGPEKLDLQANSVTDVEGNVAGYQLTWTIVTKQVAQQRLADQLTSMVENLPINVLFCDTDFNITYMNPSSSRTLRTIEEHLPCSVDQVIGRSIDIFHRDPSHQRKILSNPTNLPHNAIIQVGPEKLDLLVSSVNDNTGNSIGFQVTWSVVTTVKEVEAQLTEAVERLQNSAVTLKEVSTSMAAAAEETSNQSSVVSSAAEQVNANMSTVASAAEEMTSSIKEISTNASEAARVSREAVTVANTTNETINSLGERSEEIGNVIKVISSIAQQTNLLALNATIEAARAGEAGKGFAVVANEVKELAKQTAGATDDITVKIEAIQSATNDAVQAIGDITNIIGTISDISNTIASAVEEQAATTNEISRNVAESATGAQEIAQNITGVATAANETASGANQNLSAADNLTNLANELGSLLSRMKTEVNV